MAPTEQPLAPAVLPLDATAPPQEAPAEEAAPKAAPGAAALAAAALAAAPTTLAARTIEAKEPALSQGEAPPAGPEGALAAAMVAAPVAMGDAADATAGEAQGETREIDADVGEQCSTDAFGDDAFEDGNGRASCSVVPAAAPLAADPVSAAEDAGSRYICTICRDALLQDDATSWGHCRACRQGFHYRCVDDLFAEKRRASRESDNGADPPPDCPCCRTRFPSQSASRALQHHTPGGSCPICEQLSPGTRVEVNVSGKRHPALVVRHHEGTGLYDVEYENQAEGMSTGVSRQNIRPTDRTEGTRSTKTCGTRGCQLPDHHPGNCTPHMVNPQRRASTCSELPGADEVASGLAAAAGRSATRPAPEALSAGGSAQYPKVRLRLQRPSGRMKDGVTESDCVESHPQYDELKGAYVCMLRCAYPEDDLHPLDAHFIGWRTQVEDVRPGGHVLLYGNWLKLNNQAIRPVRQQESRPPAEEDTPVIPSAVSAAATAAAAALSADSFESAAGEDMVLEAAAGWTADVDLTHDDTLAAVVAEGIKPEDGQEGKEANADMEDAAQSSADEAGAEAGEQLVAAAGEAVGEAGASGLYSPEPLTSQQMKAYQAIYSRKRAAQQHQQRQQQQAREQQQQARGAEAATVALHYQQQQQQAQQAQQARMCEL